MYQYKERSCIPSGAPYNALVRAATAAILTCTLKERSSEKANIAEYLSHILEFLPFKFARWSFPQSWIYCISAYSASHIMRDRATNYFWELEDGREWWF